MTTTESEAATPQAQDPAKGGVENRPHKPRRYYALTLDPVHVGTGGYGLGRVDNSIVREPGTNLPKIPATSISGVCRAYSSMAIQSADPNQKKYLADDGGSCAGKGGANGDEHCGGHTCHVCMTYGFSKGSSSSSFQGLAQFYDARVLFFPVYSMKGPVWVTCKSALADCGIGGALDVEAKKFKRLDNADNEDRLNFGWLYLEKNGDRGANLTGFDASIPKIITGRAYLVPDALFSRIVNDNIEVRTSVSIDPRTGAAEDGALYTYEAIPRATIVFFDIVYNRPEYFRLKNGEPPFGAEPAKLAMVMNCVKQGLSLIQYLGLGGMNTRGMGRLRVLNPEGAELP